MADELRANKLYEAALSATDRPQQGAVFSRLRGRDRILRLRFRTHPAGAAGAHRSSSAICALRLNTLPETQGRRVDACVILGKSYREVAEAEGVNESSVRESVKIGLESMKKYLKKVL